MFFRVPNQFLSMLAIIVATGSGGCSRYELPSPPEPLKEVVWSGAEPAATAPMKSGRPLNGSFKVRGEITQYSLNGPPLRLGVEIDLVSEDGKTAQITTRKITPTDLANLTPIPQSGSVDMQGVWPIEAIGMLHSPLQLDEWLNRSTKAKGCENTPGEKTNYAFTTSSLGDDILHVYKNLQVNGSTSKNEITGYVHAKRDGAVKGLNLKIRKWTKIRGDECDLVQEETITISKGR